MTEVAFCFALFALSIVSGMLGIGVALLAVPVLSLGMSDLVNQVHPLALILNGVSASASAIAFARSGIVEWRPALIVAAVATLGAPLGAWYARVAPHSAIWAVYAISVSFVCYRMYQTPAQPAIAGSINLPGILALTFPAAAMSGFIGVGPGFLLVPLMVHFGFPMRGAAAINAVAVTPSSFAAAAPHIDHMTVSWELIGMLGLASGVGAFAGGALASTTVSPTILKRIFISTLIFTFGARVLREFI